MGRVAEVVGRPGRAAMTSVEADAVEGSMVGPRTVLAAEVGRVLGPVPGGFWARAGVETAGGRGQSGVPA